MGLLLIDNFGVNSTGNIYIGGGEIKNYHILLVFYLISMLSAQEYCAGDTISQTHQNQTFDVCYPCPDCEGWSLSDYSGNIIFIDLSASWCAPCFSSIDFLDDLEEYWSVHSSDIQFITALSDINEPLSCNQWGNAGITGSPLILEDDGTLFDWFHDSNVQYPGYVLIDHEMKIRAKPSSFIDNSNTDLCDGSVETLSEWDGGCINAMIDELLNEMHAEDGIFCDDIWACNYGSYSEGCRYPTQWDDIDGESNYNCCSECTESIDCLGECGGDATWEDCEDTEDIDLNNITFVCHPDSVDSNNIYHNTECDFLSIQEALDSDSVGDGDMVIVEQGTYYENLILQKEITLASRALFNDLSIWVGGDGENTLSNYNIKNTIINGENDTQGEQYQSVILISSPANDCISPTVFGFTLQGGDGTLGYVEEITIIDSLQSGTWDIIYYEDTLMVSKRFGGGVFLNNSMPELHYNYFTSNNADEGGGTNHGSGVDLGERGGGRSNNLRCDGDLNFSHNFYRGNDAINGNTLATNGFEGNVDMTNSFFDVYNCEDDEVSSVWVEVPDSVVVNFDFGVGDECNILDDVWVSPIGDNNNDGTSESEAFLTINRAFEMVVPDADDPPNINLTEGTFSPDLTGELFPINMVSNVNIVGQGEGVTILDAQQTGRVIVIEELRGVSISDLTVLNGFADSFFPFDCGGGIFIDDAEEIVLANLEIFGNHANNSGGGLYIDNSHDATLNSIVIEANSAYGFGGGLDLVSSDPIMENITIENNECINPDGINGTGGGANLYLSNPQINNLNVINNKSVRLGGGIFLQASNPILNTIFIHDNQVESKGGGIYIYDSNNPVLSNGTISGNSAYNGGGIYANWNSKEITLINMSITENSSVIDGGGIYITGYSMIFFPEGPGQCLDDDESQTNNCLGLYYSACLEDDTCHWETIEQNRSSIFSNHIVDSRGSGLDIFNLSYYEMIDVVLDTFTVMTPTDYYASPIEGYNFDILHSIIPDTVQVQTDLYVSPDGNNSNSGLTPEDPLKTIQYASSIIVADSFNPLTIHVLNGIYSPSTNGEVFPINMSEYVSLEGQSQDSVIINAEHTASVINCIQVDHATISNLTLKGGSAISGGGIYFKVSNISVSNLTITENNALYSGGGIYSYFSNITLSGVTISNNTAEFGGGIQCYREGLTLENSIIKNNIATDLAGGILVNRSNIIFSDEVENRSSLFSNEVGGYRGKGADISLINYDEGTYGLFNLVLDTFTVMIPTDYYVSPYEGFTFDILNSIIPDSAQVQTDLYISPDGDNSNSGLTPEDPLKTIQYASSIILPDSSNLLTIHVLNGIYSPTTNGEIFPVFINSNVSIVGQSQDSVILDAEQTAGVIRCESVNNSTISNLTIKGGLADYGGGINITRSAEIFLSNLTISENQASSYGGGIVMQWSFADLSNITISNNEAEKGGGIRSSFSVPSMINVIIKDNYAWDDGGGIFLRGEVGLMPPIFENVHITNNIAGDVGGGIYSWQYSNPIFNNVIIAENSSTNGGGGYMGFDNCNAIFNNVTMYGNETLERGGGIMLSKASSATITNSILWNDLPEEIHFSANNSDYPNETTLINSDLQGGEEGIVTNNNGTVVHETGECLGENELLCPSYINENECMVLIDMGLPCTWNSEIIELNNIDSNPLFVDPENGDYTLQTGSPCIDAGRADLNGDGTDDIIDYCGFAPDMGAYEYCLGCLDETACNYDSDAISDDGSCLYNECAGECGGDDSSCALIELHAGFNLISFYILPEDLSIANMFSPLADKLGAILGEGASAVYDDELGWIGALQEIDSSSGYWFDMLEEADFSFLGYAVDPNMEYSLHAGSNLISFPSHGSVGISDGIPDDEIEDQFLSVIGEGFAAIYEDGTWSGSLLTFEGSKGYWVDVQSELSFSYDLTNLSEDVTSRLSTHKAPTGYDYKQSSQQAFYFIENISGINPGEWIIAYNGDMVIGARQWSGEMTDVPAMGDDGSDFTTGYIEAGITPQFKLLKDDELINLTGEVPTWLDNQIFMVSSLTPVPESFNLSAAYPNPFNPTTTLDFAIPIDSKVSLSIYNLQGREVSTLINGNMDAGYHSVVWDANTYASGVYFIKMVAGEYVKTQKLMLVK